MLISFVDKLRRVMVHRSHLLASVLMGAILLVASTTTSTALAAPVADTKVKAKTPSMAGIEAEQELLEIYRLTSNGQSREALAKAQTLVNQYPHFRLAQLALADLLMARSAKGSLSQFGAAPAPMARAAASAAAQAVTDSTLALQNPSITREDLAQLQLQARARVQAHRQRPIAQTVPRELVQLGGSRYALAVDASVSRLYVFENTPQGLRLVQDFYASVGKMGLDKVAEGDRRSPSGVYFLVGELNPRKLFDIYGKGALSLNYPNEHDRRQGRTGSGIWLHGTPRDNFARVTRTTDGCVSVSNPDWLWLRAHVDLRRTPIVLSPQLQWVSQQEARRPHLDFEQTLERWRKAKSTGQAENVSFFYTPDFTSFGKPLAQWMPQLQQELQRIGKRELQLKDLSYLYWRDPSASNAEVMVVTFNELAHGETRGPTKRQYWTKQAGQWRLFFEGTIA